MTSKLLLTAAALAFITPVMAQDDAPFTDGQKDAVIQILEQHLQDKPEIVMEALQRLEENKRKAEDELAKQTIARDLDKMTAKDLPSVGNPDADVVVVEFFDYNCGYCKRAVPDIQALIKNDDNVRVVFKEMPILGPTSKTAAQYALAAHKQDKYFDYHVALMEHKGQKDEKALEAIGKDLGLDVEQLTKDAKSSEINEAIEESITMASNIGVRGTPAFIVDGQLFRGYLGPDGLKREIDKAHSE